MTREGQKRRIEVLPYEVIRKMSVKDFATLTDDFSEDLVREVLAKFARANGGQKSAWTFIKAKYTDWFEEKYPGACAGSKQAAFLQGKKFELIPEYAKEIDFDIKYGIRVINSFSDSNKAVHDTNMQNTAIENVSKYVTHIKKLQERIEELVRNQPEPISREEIDAICNGNEDSERLRARIAELERELSEQKVENEELKAENKELKAENAELRKQLEECQNQNIEQPEVKKEDWIVELLSHLCYEDEQVAKDFLEKIRGLKDTEIADIVAEWVRDNKISPKSCRRDLWRILHAAKLYEGTESNYNTAMRQRQ